jgi:hypothetical protein
MCLFVPELNIIGPRVRIELVALLFRFREANYPAATWGNVKAEQVTRILWQWLHIIS